jgi:hypothetical protein
MGSITLPFSMEEDRKQNIKASSVHVDANFEALLNAVNNKLDKDGSMLPTADISMSNHKLTGLAQPSNSGDATTKGYVDALITEVRNSIANVQAKVAENAEKVINNLKTMYPVGSVYIGTQSSCPMASLIENSVWVLVSSGRALWTGNGSNGNSKIDAGLPNITGQVSGSKTASGGSSGALYNSGTYEGAYPSGTGYSGQMIGIDASRSNSIYGKSNTVQPPAYVVNVWRRTA